MKKLFFLVLILTFGLSSSLYLQIPTWPPGGATPSEKFPKMKLPDSRYIPSTKRWNLVWADQIVPGWVTDKQVEFAAKNFIGTQKIFDYQTEQFRNFNNNFLVVIYHLALGLNPAKNSDCPDPKSNSGSGFIGVVAPKGYVSEYSEYFLPWLETYNIDVNSPRFEDMFQHYDSLRYSYRVWHQDPYWLMNPDNQDWRDYICYATLDWMNLNKNEGCFFDVAVETNCSLYNPKSSNPAPGNFNWWESPHAPYGYTGQHMNRNLFSDWMNQKYKSYFRKIYKSFHTTEYDYLIIPNIDQMVTTVYDPVWTDDSSSVKTIDGAMLENFGSYRGQDMYLTLERGFRHITKPGKILIAQFPGKDSAERMRRTAMYMLIKNYNSYINIINTGGVEWYPEYEIDLGVQDPLPARFDDLRAKGTGWESLWKRDYSNGMILCNTSNSTISYNPYSEGWSRVITSGGGTVSDEGIPQKQNISYIAFSGALNIEPSDCVILIKDTTSNLVDNFSVENSAEFEIFPNPCSNQASIEYQIPIRTNVRISIYNMTGRKALEVINESHLPGKYRMAADLSGLNSGVYICILKYEEKRIYRIIYLTK